VRNHFDHFFNLWLRSVPELEDSDFRARCDKIARNAINPFQPGHVLCTALMLELLHLLLLPFCGMHGEVHPAALYLFTEFVLCKNDSFTARVPSYLRYKAMTSSQLLDHYLGVDVNEEDLVGTSAYCHQVLIPWAPRGSRHLIHGGP
jgi:hypothetical protein